MAYYEQRSKNTYKLIVAMGYDSKGKKLRKRKTIKLSETLTQKQLEAELNRQLVLFEQEVLTGNFLDGENVTFEQFTKKWLVDYAEINLSPATLISYKTKLNSRILPAIGHIKLSKLQPMHLLSFYQNLKEDNIRLDGRYTPSEKLCNFLKPYSNPTIEKATGISFKTCKRIKEGKDTDYRTAQKMCDYYNFDINKMFHYSNDKKLTEKTIRNHIGIICSILSTAVKWNVIKDNPALRVDLKKAKKSEAKYYDDEQLAYMFKALKDEPLRYVAMVYLAIDIGLRKGELTGLSWDDINFNNSTVNINKQRHYVAGYGVIVDKTKTEAGNRIVTASKTAMHILWLYKKQQLEDKLKFGSAYKNEPYVFLHEDGSAIAPHRPYIWFTSFLKRHNLPKISFHQLRHTNASLLIASGEDIATVSGRLGHSDKNITLNTYTHLIKSREAKVANKMDEFYERLKVSI